MPPGAEAEVSLADGASAAVALRPEIRSSEAVAPAPVPATPPAPADARGNHEVPAPEGELPGLLRFLERRPDSPHAPAVRLRVERLREEEGYRAALAHNDVAGYRAFLDRFPSGAFTAEVEARIRAVEKRGTDTRARHGE